ncbi:MAG: hypothetical protein HRT56_06705, partial [Coraliomargarita sp.]|nr:hypothetical protein [Coraliomargarita sp.]
MLEELITESLRWYNLPWSLMLALVGIYWAIAVFGIIDLDFLDLNFDIDADGDVDVDADLDADTGGGFIAGALEFIHLGSLPLMVVVSGLVICA